MDNQTPEQKTETKNTSPEQKPKEIIKEIHHHHYKERGFNFSRLLFGILIVVVGLVFLAQNAGWLGKVNFDWWQLWPVLIIFFGLSLMSGKGWISAIISVVVILVILGVVALIVWGNIDLTNKTATTSTVNIEKAVDVNLAVFDIKTGAVKLNMTGGSDVLISGTHESNYLTLKDTSEVKDNVQTVTLKNEGTWQGFARHINNLDLKLNSETLLKINVDSGAADMNLDLSKVMAENVDIETGASSLKLTLGDKVEKSNLSIKAGASSVDITLPKTVGAKVKVDSGLSSKDLKDFKQVDTNHYESENYEAASKKIEMDFDLGATSLKVDWE